MEKILPDTKTRHRDYSFALFSSNFRFFCSRHERLSECNVNFFCFHFHTLCFAHIFHSDNFSMSVWKCILFPGIFRTKQNYILWYVSLSLFICFNPRTIIIFPQSKCFSSYCGGLCIFMWMKQSGRVPKFEVLWEILIKNHIY